MPRPFGPLVGAAETIVVVKPAHVLFLGSLVLAAYGVAFAVSPSLVGRLVGLELASPNAACLRLRARLAT